MNSAKLNPTYIELFAGCGGLSLGLEAAGFNLLFANELSPMAAETYAHNILGENLRSPISQTNKIGRKTVWLQSKFDSNNIESRLREVPIDAPHGATTYCDISIPTELEELKEKLVVGSIVKLNELLMDPRNADLVEQIRGLQVDLVSGGPPCQSFSLAGLRQHDNKRNALPEEFAKFVGIVRPKIAILENVQGILNAFSIFSEGTTKRYEAWHEVAKAFVQKEYIPLCLLVNAKYAGVAQNRPRFIMFAIRKDFFFSTFAHENNSEPWQNSINFYNAAQGNPEIALKASRLKYWDIEKDGSVFKNGFLSSLLKYGPQLTEPWHTVQEAINDLTHKPSSGTSSRYLEKLNKEFRDLNPHSLPAAKHKNNNKRNNSLAVRQRFRIYQVLSKLQKNNPALYREALSFLRGSISELSVATVDFLGAQDYLFSDESSAFGFLAELPRIDREFIEKYLLKYMTKKQSQRALIAGYPAPAALSIPDDCCHYSESIEDIRTLTVREMARIQSFPDWFEFRSKVTTGGQLRKVETPQYTQVGNAVPPLLGLEIGKAALRLLNKLEAVSPRA